jgi:hypothetical protein
MFYTFSSFVFFYSLFHKIKQLLIYYRFISWLIIFVAIFVIDLQSILSREDTLKKLETYRALERLLHAYLSN